MTIEIRSQARRMILGCLCAVAATASACGDGRGVPTSPSPSAAASSPSATAPDVQRPESVVVARSLSGSSPNRSLLLTKTCDAFNHCTVVTSEAGPIPVGTEALYAGPLLEQRTTSAVVLTTPNGDTATGNCSLNYKTGLGTCVFTSGTGALAGFHANLKVTSDFVTNPEGVFTWSGEYRFVGRE